MLINLNLIIHYSHQHIINLFVKFVLLMIVNKIDKMFLCIHFTLKDELYKNQLWLKDYLFSYDTIEKNKLINMFL